MPWLWLALAAALGAAASSFLQVAVDRAAAADGSLLARSRCPRCRTVLRGRQLLPVLGFVLSRGRCAACTMTIPHRHLLGELGGAVVWAGVAALTGPTWWLPALLVVPAAAVLLATPAVRGRGPRAVLVPLLVITGVAVLPVGLGAAATGRWALYLTAGAVAALALVLAVWLEKGPRPAAA
jgi:prepilin signal peptidase PulO-like enzyme (type II secretory pathway)